jgi:DNA polymerase-3 subunit epsilon
MKFAALDVETANRRQRSICQIAVVVFDNGREIASDVVYVDPEDEFEPTNVRLHGIGPEQVLGALTFPKVHSRLRTVLSGHFVVSHHTFDPVAIRQACNFYQLEDINCRWLDSCASARRAWPHLKERGGHGLKNLAEHFGISLRHHDALDDARAAGLVMLRAMDETGVDLEGWLAATQPKARSGYAGSNRSLAREGDGDGPLLGENIVFTGNFSVDKYELADMAHVAGAAVSEGMSKKVTMVVVGQQDTSVVGASGKSQKQRRAEELVAQGMPILMVNEDDFRELTRGPGGL